MTFVFAGQSRNSALFICVFNYSTQQTLLAKMDMHMALLRCKPKFCFLRHNTNLVRIQFQVNGEPRNKAVLSLIIRQLLSLPPFPASSLNITQRHITTGQHAALCGLIQTSRAEILSLLIWMVLMQLVLTSSTCSLQLILCLTPLHQRDRLCF